MKLISRMTVFALVLVLVACGDSKDKTAVQPKAQTEKKAEKSKSKKSLPGKPKVVLGKIVDDVYVSKTLGMRMPIPAGWHQMSEGSRKQAMLRGAKIIARKNKKFMQLMVVAQDRTHHLFSFYRYPASKPSFFNASLIALAENRTLATKVDTSRGYLLKVKDLLKRSRLRYRVSDQLKTEKIGDVKFDVLYAYAQWGGIKITQEYYVAYIGDYAVSFVATYSKDDEKKLLKDIIAKAEIK